MTRIVLPIICMCVSMCQSLTMLAQNAVEVTYSDKTIFYDNFTDAFKEANKSDGAYLKLLEDVSFEGQAPSFSVTKQMTIDLNGHSLGDTLTKANLIEVNADTAVLRLTSSQTGGKIIAIRDYKWKIATIDVKQGRLEAENITIETSNLRSYSNEGQSAAAAPINVASIGAISVKNCVLKAQADSYPYGISSSSTKEACPDIELKNSSILSQGKRYVYGIKTFPKTLIDNCKIDIESDSTFVYGIHIGNFTDSINFTATPVPTISNVCINIKGKADRIYTIFSNSNINLISDTINAEGSRSVFGVYCNNSATVTKSKVNVTSSDKTAYALYMSNDTANAVVSDCHFTAEAGYTSATALYVQNGSLVAKNSSFEAVSRLDTATVRTDASTAAVRVYAQQSTAQISNCSLIAKAQKQQLAKNVTGLQMRGSGQVDGCTIEAHTGYSGSTGISLSALSVAKIADTDIKSYGILDVKGITGSIDSKLRKSTHLEIENCDITAEGDENCYPVSTYSDLYVANSVLSANAKTINARAIFLLNDSLQEQQPIAKIENVTISLVAANNAYGVYSSSKFVMDNDSIYAYADNNSRCVYATNSATIRNCSLFAESKYESARTMYVSQDVSPVEITDCRFKAESGYNGATAINVGKGSVIAKNSSFDAISRLDTATVLTDASTAALRLQHPDAVNIIKNCTLSAQAPKPDFSRNVCGLQLGGKADIDSCQITSMAGYSSSYAISLLSTAELNLSNSHLKSDANQIVYGIYANGVGQNIASMSVDNCRIEVEGDDNYGISAYSKLDVFRSEISALSVSKAARGIVVNNFFDSIQNVKVTGSISDVKIDVRSQMSAVGIMSKGVISLLNDTLSVVTDSAATGLYLTNTADVNQCDVYVSAKRNRAYGIDQYDTAVVRNSTITAISKEQNANAVSPYATSSTTLYDCRLKTSAATDSAMIGRTYNFAGTIVLHNGYYSNDENIRGFLPSDTCAVYAITEGKEYNEGYRFIIRPISDPEMDIAYIYDDRQTLKAQFAHVEEALEYVNKFDEELTIVVRGTSILPKGKYHIPKKTTLLVPFFAEQKSAIGNIAMRNTEKTQPTEYVRLILSDSVFITVDGAIELSGIQCAKGTQSAYPIGNYGHIFIPESSEIVLNDNSELRAWGYITGSGNIIAKTGSRVYENLQLGDWKGGALTISIMHNYQRVFPISHYFYQNIECLITYHSGAEAFASTSNIVNGVTMMGDDIRIVGTGNSLFNMKENTTDWIKKKYEPQTDRLTWITNGDVALEKLAVKMLSEEITIEISSDEYVLPIPTNMSIVCQNGNFDFSHDAVFLPSSEMIVAHDAHINIPDSVGVYLYGADEIEECFGKRYNTVAYSPSWTQCPRDSVLKPALCNIEGIVDVYGNLFSTDSGADVVGNNDKGQPKIVFHTPAEMDYIYQIVGDRDNFSFKAKRVTSTPLTNADGTRVQTKESIDYEEDIFIPEEYNYINGEWILSKQNIGTINIENTLSRPNNKTKVMIEKGIMYIVLPDGKLITTLGTRMQK